MEKLSHAEYIDQLRRDAGRIASATIAGDLDILEACWVLWPLLARAELVTGDPDIVAIGQVYSELHGTPLGKVRALWAPQALEQQAPELESLKAWAFPLAMPAVQSVAARFQG